MDSFVRELDAALSTRGLITAIQCRAPTFDTVANANGGAQVDEIQQLLDKLLSDRQTKLQAAAANLPNLVKVSALSFMEQQEFNRQSLGDTSV